MSIPLRSQPQPAQDRRSRHYRLPYGDEVIHFEQYAGKRGARVRIKVLPDCRVQVAAPPEASDREVLAAVAKRAPWIWRQLEQFRSHGEYAQPRGYRSGESHYYLGRRHLLKVHVAPEASQGVKLLHGRLEVTAKTPDGNRVRDLLNDWYRTRARDVFRRRLEALLLQTLWVETKPPLRLQTMRTQWGTCSPKGRITLNPHLVKASRDCIDYVILHELCHLAEHNHSPRFYRLMDRVMPGWESAKTALDEKAVVLLSQNRIEESQV